MIRALVTYFNLRDTTARQLLENSKRTAINEYLRTTDDGKLAINHRNSVSITMDANYKHFQWRGNVVCRNEISYHRRHRYLATYLYEI